jgi:hypothetical protein
MRIGNVPLWPVQYADGTILALDGPRRGVDVELAAPRCPTGS